MASNPNERLITTIGMMDATAAEHDGEAVNAFRAATRMLKAQGLNWTELAKMALDRPSLRPLGTEAVAKAQGFADVFDGAFADIFGGAGFRRAGTGHAAPPPPPRKPSRLHGVDVPEMVKGIVRVVDADRKAKTGAMLVLEIVGDDTIYGPLVCFSQSVIDDLRKSVDEGRPVIARIQRPRTDTHHPVVLTANVTGD